VRIGFAMLVVGQCLYYPIQTGFRDVEMFRQSS
jgi:hypothetical protein